MVTSGAVRVSATVVAFCMLSAAPALAQDDQQPINAQQAEAAIKTADERKDLSTLPEAPLEAPPPPPHRNGFVLEQSLGAQGFVGKFGGLIGHPIPWIQTIFGYELFRCHDENGNLRGCPFELMVFGEGDLGFGDTGSSVGPSQNRPFPILAFGGGLRLGFQFTHRFGMYVEGLAGGDVAYVQSGVLVNFGYGKAEALGFQVGGRLGVEWFQIDRHLGLGLSGGARYMANLAYEVGGDLPLAWDATADLRYTF